MPPLRCPVLVLRPVPPQCRFAWQGLPFMPFGYRSPVGLSGPVIIFVTCGHMRRFGYSLPWGIMPGYNLFNCHPKCHLPPGRIYNRFFHIHKIVFSITSCINFCEWPAASRRSPLCELRASRAAVPPLSAPQSTIASTYFLSSHSLSVFPFVHSLVAVTFSSTPVPSQRWSSV